MFAAIRLLRTEVAKRPVVFAGASDDRTRVTSVADFFAAEVDREGATGDGRSPRTSSV